MHRAKVAAEAFLLSQFELAQMYVGIAVTAEDPVRRSRHAAHARRVLSVLKAHLARQQDAGGESERIRQAIAKLELRLDASER